MARFSVCADLIANNARQPDNRELFSELIKEPNHLHALVQTGEPVLALCVTAMSAV
jgi:hypothetical protein